MEWLKSKCFYFPSRRAISGRTLISDISKERANPQINMNSRCHRLIPVFLSVLMMFSFSAQANDLSGYFGGEARYFFNEPLSSEQSEHNAAITANVEYFHDFDGGDQRIAVTGFARVDSEDSERSHADLRELYWWKNFGGFEIYAGIRKVFWGVTESIHLVDVLNQTDNLENIDGEDKLGQPMIELVTAQDWGTVSAYILPYFRERQFLGKDSRLRPGIRILDDAQYQSSDEEQHVDFALRWSHYIGIWDIGLSHFSGTGRDPIFDVVFTDSGEPVLRPLYRQIDQAGLDLQATVDAWLLKLEAISISEKNGPQNTAFVGGLEYSFFTVGGTNADLGIVSEYQFDDRTGPRQTASQNDLVLGFRWAFNDVDGSEILALMSQDLDHSNRFFSLEFSRRLNDKWKVEAEARVFSSIDSDTLEYSFREDDYIKIEIRRYF